MDTIFARKASQLPMSTVFTVTDDDTAGIKINTNVLTIQEDGLAKSINFIGLSTKPVANVEIRIHVDSSLIDAMPISFNINRDTTESTWKSINQQISFRAKNGASSATARIVCSSNDQKYNGTFTEVSIIVQPLQRTLNVPKDGSTTEGQSYTYTLSLTTVPLSNVAIQLNVIGSCAISNSTLIVSDKKEQSITVQAPDNFVDEGATTAYTCMINHTLISADTVYNRQSHFLNLAVSNNDVADAKLWTYNVKTKAFTHAVKFVGPLCNDEGSIIEVFGIQLETEPMHNVVIVPKVTMRNTTNILLAPQLVLYILHLLLGVQTGV